MPKQALTGPYPNSHPSTRGEATGSAITWMVDVGVRETPPPATHNPIVAIEKSPLPFDFSVEAGAYINAIRSGLDILAVALGARCNMRNLKEAYFPVASSEAEFLRGKYKGAALIKALPDMERRMIESLKPYEGGNKSLWLLHHLDITRKHHRLLGVAARPAKLTLSGRGDFGDFAPVRTDSGWVRVNNETVVGFIKKGAPDYEAKYACHIALNEPDILPGYPIITALENFARAATGIIGLFDASH